MEGVCSLNFIEVGGYAEIMDISGGNTILKKLMEMGVVKGSTIQIMQNNTGPIIIKSGNSRLVIGRGMAQKIFVKEM